MAELEFGHSAKHIAPPEARRQPAATAAALDPHSRATARHDGSSAALAGLHPGTARTADAAPSAEVSAAELHPSWAAKSAAKAQLAAKPAGTKVVFSDDGDPVAAAEPAADGTRHLPPPPAARPRVGAAVGAAAKAAAPAANGQQPRDTPHAAGRVPGVLRHRDQRQATANPAPGVSGKRPAAKLHPSWEAKAKLRKQMEHLPAPAGTKVVFDDSD
jgi:BUD22